jgi:galactonate dehydratase
MTNRLTRRNLLACGAVFAAVRRLSIRKLVTRKHTIANRDYLFVEIETDGGITGIGEGSISGRVEIVEKAIQWFAPYLEGKDPGGIEDHWNQNYYELSRYREGAVLQTALAAVDIALWDIEAKRLGEPLWRLLGSAEARPMRVYYSHWSQGLEPRTPQRLAELASRTKAEGWTCVKWVLPKGGTESERLRRLVAEVEAVRNGGGPDLEIGLEMWETFSVRSAIEFSRAVAPFRPMFIEEPVWREMPQALGEIAAQSPVALAGGEGLVSRYEFKQLLDAKGARILQPDVIHCGGITEIRKIASLGEVYGAEMAPHMFYGPVAHVASLQSMAGVRNFLMQEWDVAMQPVFSEVTRSTFPVAVKGHVTLPSSPGLGIEMDWEVLDRKYPYRSQSMRRPGGR